MAFDLCVAQQASRPYYIKNINTGIYSLEELCYYLYENVYLIDQTIINEELCDWIRDELGLKRLYRQLYEQLEREEGVSFFVLSIFREAGYLTPKLMKEFQEKLGKLDVQPDDAKAKLKGDYLVRSGMYADALSEYAKILEKEGPGGGGAAFYAQIYNNMGCALARLFRFREAANCFREAWRLVHTKDALRRYISVLPLYLSEDAYKKKLEELGAEDWLIERIHDYSLKMVKKARDEGFRNDPSPEKMAETLEIMKEEYRRSAK